MLFRFSLYGFLKNQRYFDLFMVLAFREKHLSWTMIGVLIGVREIGIALLEVPTGAIADVVGRRRSMIFSFLAYVASFALFGLGEKVWMLFPAMLLFSVGEAFRTGTHKAMIFEWLARQGRANEKTKVYGLTRSWSQIGAAVSVVIAAVLVFVSGRYSYAFLFCIVPYLANIVNFLTYPAYLDGERRGEAGFRTVLRTMWDTLGECARRRPLRRLLSESMGFEGVFRATKGYAQPLIQAAAMSLPLLVSHTGLQRTAVLVGAVGVVLYVLSSIASRRAHWFVERAGSERRGAIWLWGLNLGIFAGMLAGMLLRVPGVAVAAFVALAIIQNFWRPILISRIADQGDPARTATLLSIESEGKTLFAAAVAPLLGWAVDATAQAAPELRFVPVAVLGAVVAAGMLLTGRRRPPGEAGTPKP